MTTNFNIENEHVRDGNHPRSEEEALDAMDRGDRVAALAWMMRTYGDSIYRYCVKMVRDRSVADDVHQTVFVQAYEDIQHFSRRSSLRSWLYAIAHHRCLDALKVNRRWQERFLIPEALPDRPDPRPATDDALMAQTLSAALGNCLEALTPHVRTAILLHYGEGFTYEEMARMCSARATTLQARVARAMPWLRRCIEARWGTL